MGTWWRFRQWIYARPRIAGGAAAVVLSVIGFSGWASARIATHSERPQSRVAVQRTTVVRTIAVRHRAGRGSDVVRTLSGPVRTRTVVVTRRVTRVVPTMQVRTRLVALPPSTVVKTITAVERQTAPSGQTVTRIVTTTVTHTATQSQPAETIVHTVTTPPGHATSTGRETRTVTVTVATVTVTVPKGH
jgi:hypothetical protein